MYIGIGGGGVWEDASHRVDEDGEKGAREEEPEEAGVDLARGEHACWADGASDDGGIEEDAAVGAGCSCLVG